MEGFMTKYVYKHFKIIFYKDSMVYFENSNDDIVVLFSSFIRNDMMVKKKKIKKNG
jgi:hypothetical protein